MSKWLNTKKIQMGINNGDWNDFYKWLQEGNKPCHACGYCPYGKLVEEYQLREVPNEIFSCKAFGHDCPAFYMAEPIMEEIVEENGRDN